MRYRMIFMTGAVVAALTACNDRANSPTEAGSPSFSQQGGGGQDTTSGASHYTANGLNASANWFNGSFDSTGASGGFEWGSVYAYTINDVRNEAVVVNYYVTRCDIFWSCATTAAGYGTVPKSAITGSANSMTLDVTPADFPGSFFVWAGSGGRIHLSWRAIDGYSTRSSGIFEATTPWYRFLSNGEGSSSSAVVAGVLDGSTIPAGAGGSIGTSHNVTLSFQR